ncbi:MAG TPA: DUF5131 family protein [Kineosporiaceae bacterium]|nr:DUF5131 family protein [Kineosporiaceae bacterium]
MGDTGIDYVTRSWPVVEGCNRVSPGCDNCWAESLIGTRLKHLPLYDGLTAGGRWTGVVRTVPSRVLEPLTWHTPEIVFVAPRGDLFHPAVPADFLARVFAVMAMSPRQTFLLLTKRPARARKVLSSDQFWWEVGEHGLGIAVARTRGQHRASGPMQLTANSTPGGPWECVHPLGNVWVGVSIEDQDHARRADELRRVPAAHRWVSAEPLLGPVDLSPWLAEECGECQGSGDFVDGPTCHVCLGAGRRDGIDWVVAGGETGRGARPMHPDWVRSLRDQCEEAAVPFMFKQWGSWGSRDDCPAVAATGVWLYPDGSRTTGALSSPALARQVGEPAAMFPMPKKLSGRRIDGTVHTVMPFARLVGDRLEPTTQPVAAP